MAQTNAGTIDHGLNQYVVTSQLDPRHRLWTESDTPAFFIRGRMLEILAVGSSDSTEGLKMLQSTTEFYISSGGEYVFDWHS